MVCVPRDGVKVFDRHLTAASVPKTDERGRTVDLRVRWHTFNGPFGPGPSLPSVAGARDAACHFIQTLT